MTSVTKTGLDRIPTKRDWVLPIAMFVLSLVASGLIAYAQGERAASNRVTAVENQQKNDGQRLDRMESKLDRLLERVK